MNCFKAFQNNKLIQIVRFIPSFLNRMQKKSVVVSVRIPKLQVIPLKTLSQMLVHIIMSRVMRKPMLVKN